MVRRRWTFLGTAVLAATALLGSGGAAAGAAQPSSAQPSYYLALGDSVAFGYTPPQVTPPQWYQDARNFRGYPEDLASWFGLDDVNASCPGETSASFLDVTAQSNGCENSIGSDLGYRDAYPLHVRYPGSQFAYATHFLNKNRAATKLISINIGANDVFVCQETTPDHCTGADFPALMATIGQNLSTILQGLRATGYHGKLVVLTYYAISYTDPVQVVGTQLLNSTLSSAAKRYHAIVANGYTAFKHVSASHHGDPCAAGLLVRLPTGDCNIHPSAYGHIILADAIAKAAGESSPIG